MRTFLKWAFLIVLLAGMIHLAWVYCYPELEMNRAGTKILSGPGTDVNRLILPPPTSDASRDVVKPSPDLLYAICVYDLSSGPLRISSPPADSYWSCSLFGSDAVNYFVSGDSDLGSKPLDLLLVGPNGLRAVDAGGARVVESPSSTGIILWRYLVTGPAQLVKLMQLRRTISIKIVHRD